MKKPGEKRYILLDLFVALLMLMLCANMTIIRNSDPYVSNDISKIPQTNVGLLLGTSKLLKNGQNNDFFFNRIEAAVELYKKGKIKYILVSGDNGSKFYNEPRDMRDELIRRGVPANVIYLDYAGFRTLDSVVRAHKIFGQDSFTVISQKFHKNSTTNAPFSLRENLTSRLTDTTLKTWLLTAVSRPNCGNFSPEPKSSSISSWALIPSF